MTQGYILKLFGDRVSVFESNVHYFGNFAEPVAFFSHKRASMLIVFVSVNAGEIDYLAFGSPGKKAGTDLRRLNLDKIFTLQRPFPFSSILERVPSTVKKRVGSTWEKGGILPPESFLAVTKAILDLYPETKDVLDRFTTETKEAMKELSPRAISSLASQKEAINTALDLAGIDRDPLLEWILDPKKTTSFLDGLSQAYLREDAMILNDMNYIPGLDKIRSSIHGVAQFTDAHVRLDVIYANRTRLEEQTGTDLIYFNATYRSFVMVQYKAMERSAGGGSAAFRLPNALLAKEIEQMEKLLTSLKRIPESAHRHGYRILDNPFFLKICKRIVLNPDDVELTPGMYFSLDHWKILEMDEDLVGKLGGKVVSFENAGRYLTNTEFAALVQRAWIGTTPAQSAILEQIIAETLESGKSLMFAIKSDW